LFFGLLLLKEKEELQKIVFNNSRLFDFFNGLQTQTDQVKVFRWLREVYYIYNDLVATYNNFIIPNDVTGQVSSSGKQIISSLNSIVALLNSVNNLDILNANVDIKVLNEISVVAVNVTQIASNITDKNYGLALTNLVNVYLTRGYSSLTPTQSTWLKSMAVLLSL
jgi:hypothetical protein